jgi:sulfide:quinone oxidoreductase
MNLMQLSETFYVSGQISPVDIDELKARGFGTIICNRPDGEDSPQPTAEEMKLVIEQAGMKFFNVPFNPMNPDPNMVNDFSDALNQSEGLVLAYCRSGQRSSRLWAAVNQG